MIETLLLSLILTSSANAITGGTNAAVGQFPYHAAIEFFDTDFGDQHVSEYFYVCGGTILSPTWVLTSVTCSSSFLQYYNTSSRVVAGIASLNHEGTQVRNIVELVNHEEFRRYFSFTINDIALVRLDAALDFSDNFVEPVRLPEDSSLIPSGEATFVGWDQTNLPIAEDAPIKTATYTLLDNSDCLEAFGQVFVDGDPDAAGFFNVTADLCLDLTFGLDNWPDFDVRYTDLGSILVQDDVLVGLDSWVTIYYSIGSDGGVAPVFTNVAFYLDFIKQYVKDLPKIK